jgi:hypothetical protein
VNKQILDWLMTGSPWLKYAVETQLLGKESDVRQVLQDKPIARIIERLKGNQAGLPGILSGKVTYTETGKAYWDLFFLADIGLTIADLGLQNEVSNILNLQSRNGCFVLPPNVKDNYFCMSGILLSSVARMGYREDPRIRKYIQAILSAQSHDGGWHCFEDYDEMGDMAACPMDNLNILMLLGQYDSYTRDPGLNRALDQLIDHWSRREHDRRLYGFGIGKRYMSLQYPAVKYGILRVLDVLSLFPFAVERPGFKEMLEFVQGKAQDGKYVPENAESAYKEFDFAQTEKPSRWLTFLVNRIEKQVSGA